MCACGCVLCVEVLAVAGNCIGSLRLGVKGECLPQIWVTGTEMGGWQEVEILNK